jgi:hypothetical protein
VTQAATIAGAFLTVSGALILLWKAFVRLVHEAVGGSIDKLKLQLSEQDSDFTQTVSEVNLRLDAIHSELCEVRKQVLPNSGSSLRDRVDALYQLVLTS